MEETVLVRAAVDARRVRERIVEQEMRVITVLVLVVQHAPVIIRGNGREGIAIPETVVHVCRAAVALGIATAGSIVHADIVVVGSDGNPTQHIRLR
jgi:hypothetical protein